MKWIRGLAKLCAIVIAVGMLAGCGGDPSGPDAGTGTPLVMDVHYLPLVADMAVDASKESAPQFDHTVTVNIYDVTGEPLTPTAELVNEGREPVFAETTVVDVPDGETVLIENSHDLEIGETPMDFRVLVDVTADDVIGRKGTRTVEQLARGGNQTVDLYLTPSGEPSEGEFGIQLAESWAETGVESHLVPVVLINADRAAGFQFDLTFDTASVAGVSDIFLDADSRLYLQADSSSLANRGFSEIADPAAERWRILSFSSDSLSTLSAGYDIVLYVEVDLLPGATTHDVGVDSVVVTDPTGATFDAVFIEEGAPLHIGE